MMSRAPWCFDHTIGGIAFAAVLAACGARSPLREIDAEFSGTDAPDIRDPIDTVDASDAFDALDARDVVDAPDRVDVCIDFRADLPPRPADILFVFDRSSSMGWNLSGGTGGTSRWTILRNALTASLPAFAATTRMGAMLFPDNTSSCSISSVVPIPPAISNAAAVLDLVNRNGPAGLTPTSAAIDVAGRFFASRVPDGRGRAIVLATDGAPNCNESLPPATCPCTASGNPRPPCSSATLCLDDRRAIDTIAAAARMGVPVYVIGIDEDGRADLVRVMNDMAVAGGRPNPSGATRYYSVRAMADLPRALDTIQRLIAACVFRVSATPPDLLRVQVEADGTLVAHDVTHVDGWDWIDDSRAEVALFGPACDRLLGHAARVSAIVPCRE